MHSTKGNHVPQLRESSRSGLESTGSLRAIWIGQPLAIGYEWRAPGVRAGISCYSPYRYVREPRSPNNSPSILVADGYVHVMAFVNGAIQLPNFETVAYIPASATNRKRCLSSIREVLVCSEKRSVSQGASECTWPFHQIRVPIAICVCEDNETQPARRKLDSIMGLWGIEAGYNNTNPSVNGCLKSSRTTHFISRVVTLKSECSGLYRVGPSVAIRVGC